MIDYFIVFFICTLCTLFISILRNRFDKIILFFVVSLILIIFSGFRYNTGWDFEIYQYLYDSVFYSNDPLSVIRHADYQDFEKGFRIFSLSAIISPYMPVLLSCSISVGVSFLIMYKSPSKTFGAFILLYLWYEYFAVFNIQRQIIAHAIILLGVYLTLSHNRKYYLFISAPLAFTFHVSSFLFFLFYLFAVLLIEKNFKLKFRTGISLVLISLLLIVFPINISYFVHQVLTFVLGHMGDIGQHASIKIGYYFNYLELYKTGISFRYLEYILVFLIALYKSQYILDNIRSDYGKKIFLLSLYISAIHILMYALLSGFGVIQERVESYFLLMHVILMSYLSIIFIKNIKTYLLIVILCFSFVFIKYYRLIQSDSYIGADSHYQRFIPYNNIFTGY